MTPTRSAPLVRRVHVVVVLDPHGTNRSVVHAALDRPSDETLLVDLVVLAELAHSRALAMAALDIALQRVHARRPDAVVRTFLGCTDVAGWAGQAGVGGDADGHPDAIYAPASVARALTDLGPGGGGRVVTVVD